MSEVPSKPWMHDSEINLIIAFLNKEQSMLEWGCGGSTMLFSKYVKKYYSKIHIFNIKNERSLKFFLMSML